MFSLNLLRIMMRGVSYYVWFLKVVCLYECGDKQLAGNTVYAFCFKKYSNLCYSGPFMN